MYTSCKLQDNLEEICSSNNGLWLGTVNNIKNACSPKLSPPKVIKQIIVFHNKAIVEFEVDRKLDNFTLIYSLLNEEEYIDVKNNSFQYVSKVGLKYSYKFTIIGLEQKKKYSVCLKISSKNIRNYMSNYSNYYDFETKCNPIFTFDKCKDNYGPSEIGSPEVINKDPNALDKWPYFLKIKRIIVVVLILKIQIERNIVKVTMNTVVQDFKIINILMKNAYQ